MSEQLEEFEKHAERAGIQDARDKNITFFAWQARQPEIDALIHDNDNMRKAIVEYDKENAALKAENERLLQALAGVDFQAAPTPPAQGDKPVGFVGQSTIDGLKAGKRVQNWILSKKNDDPDFCEMNVPLYTRPDNTELRKAAGALIWAYDNHEYCITEIGDLRAALEGK